MEVAKALAWAAVGSACSLLGCSPADLGNPGAEGKKVLPAALSLNIDEFPEDNSSPTARRLMGIPGTGHGRFCVMGPTIMHRFQQLVDSGLQLSAQINEDLGEIDGTTLAATFTVGQREVAYKADFAAFDIDGDGTADGSGTPDTAPVALRLWVDTQGTGEYEPLLCALITTLPDDSTTGAGQLYVQPGVLVPAAPADFKAYLAWDRSDPAHLWNEGWFEGRLRVGYHMVASHARIDLATGEDGKVEKTLRNSGTLVDNPMGIGEMRYASRTLEGLGRGLLSAEAIGSGINAEFNICTSFENCSMAPEDCSGIDPEGMDFLDAPTGGEADWPAGFPAAPTF